MNWQPYFELDALSMGLLPPGWDDDIITAIEKYAKRTILTGDSEFSKEDKEHVSVVHVVTGDDCERAVPWLMGLYRGVFLDFASRSFGFSLFHSEDLRSSVNVNCLRGLGSDYEKHVDTNPVTGLLFVSAANFNTGGQLIFESYDGRRCEINPSPGKFICFDARALPHFVSRLRCDFDRISIPMNYYDRPREQCRPVGLDSRLYDR